MPTTLDQVINYTQLYQDVELASAMTALSNNPSALQSFLSASQDNVYSQITAQKQNTFEKVYGDLSDGGRVAESVLQWNKRNKELMNIENQIYSTQKNAADAVTDDKQLAGRKAEMNEWTVNNKKDTLFVFSSLFIMLSGLLLITVLWRMGLVSAYLWASLAAPLIIIFVLIVINRAQYTNSVRNQHFWNKRVFNKEGKIALPSCAGLSNMLDDAQNTVKNNMANFSGSAANAANAANAAVAALSNT